MLLGKCLQQYKISFLNALHPDISMYILHIILFTFLKLQTRRICLTINSFFNWWSIPQFSWPLCLIQGWHCNEKKDAGQSLWFKGWKFQKFGTPETLLLTAVSVKLNLIPQGTHYSEQTPVHRFPQAYYEVTFPSHILQRRKQLQL